MTKVSIIIFSKNRILQLHAALASLFRHVYPLEECVISVIYHPCSSYSSLEIIYPQVRFIKETIDLDTSSFQEDFLSCLALAPFCLLMVDDSIFVRDVNLKEPSFILNRYSEILGVSFRLGKNTNYCFVCEGHQRIPICDEIKLPSKLRPLVSGSLDMETTDLSSHGLLTSTPPSDFAPILSYDWEHEQLDFAYPLEVSSSFYRKNDIFSYLIGKSYSNPNQLENHLVDSKPFALLQGKVFFCMYQTSRAMSLPLNSVQSNQKKNKVSKREYAVDELNAKYKEGYRISVETFDNFLPYAVHQDVLNFEDYLCKIPL